MYIWAHLSDNSVSLLPRAHAVAQKLAKLNWQFMSSLRYMNLRVSDNLTIS